MIVGKVPASFRFRYAAWTLHDGGVIAYPTEAVWGLGCDPSNDQAIERLITLKQRSAAKGLILIASSAEQLLPYIQPLEKAQWARLVAPCSRPVSWVVPASDQASVLLTGGRSTIAVRVSTHPTVCKLCEAFGGAIVSTSANVSGRSAAKSAWQVRHALGRNVDLIVHGNLGGQTKPSEIRDLLSDAIIRA